MTYSDLLFRMKERRRNLVDALDHTDDLADADMLARCQIVIQAIEAVMGEPKPEPTGPRPTYRQDGA